MRSLFSLDEFPVYGGFAAGGPFMDFYEGRVLAMILAGGRGERLRPLTENRAKAAVPFGGMCRLIDFVLSNMVNSGIREIYVLTQYKAHSLIRHLQQKWAVTQPFDGFLLMPVPPQMNGRESFYLGTADALYQNLGLLRRRAPELVLVFGSDHVYSMDIKPMIRRHLEKRAEVTVATIPIPSCQSPQFGTVRVDEEWRIRDFEEKTADPHTVPGHPDLCLASMGNYIFDRRALIEELLEDAADEHSSHDLGRDILPRICGRRRVYAYDFRSNILPGETRPADYWRDVGTIGSYFQANMDLNNPRSNLNLYSPEWPLRLLRHHGLPAKVTSGFSGKSGFVENSILGHSTIVSGGYVRNSVIGPRVRILSGAVVEDSVVLGDTLIKEGAKIRRAIIDHGNVIGEDARIGFDRDRDASRYHVDKAGIVVLPHAALPARLKGGIHERPMPFLLGQEHQAGQPGGRQDSGEEAASADAVLRL